jgi:hypothetical protein
MAILSLGRSILIVDFTDPSRPRLSGSQSFDGQVLDVQRDGQLLAVLVLEPDDEFARVLLVDLSFPSSPRVTVAATLDGLRVMALDRARLLAVSSNTLWVVDVSNPTAPVTLSRTDIPCAEPVRAAAGSGEMAIACGEQSVVIVDASDPEAPLLVGSGVVEEATRVAGDRGRWAVEQPGAGIKLVATGTKGSPGVIAPEQAGCLDTLLDFDGRILLTRDAQKFGIVDVQTGQSSVQQFLARASVTEEGRLMTLRIDGAGTRLELGALTAELGIDTRAAIDLTMFATVSDMAFDGSRAAVSFEQGGIMIVDVSNPSSPHVVHSLEHHDHITSIAWAEAHEVAIVDEQGVLYLVSFKDPSADPVTRTFEPENEGVRLLDVIASGSTLVVSDTSARLTILAHQGVKTPEPLDSIGLFRASIILAAHGGRILAVARDEADQRVAQLVELSFHALSFGLVGDPWPVLATNPIACADAIVDLAPGENATLRYRPIDGVNVRDEPELVRAIDTPSALACVGDAVWTASPTGVLVFERDQSGDARITQTAPPVDRGGAAALEMLAIGGALAVRMDGGVFLAETSLPPIPVLERIEFAAGSAAPIADVVTTSGRTLVARGNEVVDIDGVLLTLPVASPVVALEIVDGGIAAVTRGGQIAVVLVGKKGPPELVSVVDVGEDSFRAAFTHQAACLALPSGGLIVVDLRDPALPALGETLLGEEAVLDVTAVDLTCWVLLDQGRIAAVSLVDPGSPRLIEVTIEPGLGHPTRLWSAAGSLVAAESDELIVLHWLEPMALELSHRIELPAAIDRLYDAGGGLTIAAGSSIWFLSHVEDDGSSDLVGSIRGDYTPAGLHVDARSLWATGTDSVWVLSLECPLEDDKPSMP